MVPPARVSQSVERVEAAVPVVIIWSVILGACALAIGPFLVPVVTELQDIPTRILVWVGASVVSLFVMNLPDHTPEPGAWEYQGVTGPVVKAHTWSNGPQTLSVYGIEVGGDFQGFAVGVRGVDGDLQARLEAGLIDDFRDALVIADLYMREDRPRPGRYIYSTLPDERVPTYPTPQKEWLDRYADQYQFQIVGPEIAG